MLGLSCSHSALATRVRSGPLPIATYNFMSGNLPAGVTLARNTTGTVVDASGGIATIQPNIARFDYASSGFGLLGMLVETDRTNYITQSELISATIWRKNGTNVSQDAVTSPHPLSLADKIVEDTSTGRHDAEYNFGAAQTGDIYSFSAFLKASETSKVRLRCGRDDGTESVTINLATGSVSDIGSNIIDYGILALSSGWYRITLTVSISQNSVAQYAQIRLLDANGSDSYVGDGVSGLYCWGAQLETHDTASSYVPTSGAASTRAADVVSLSAHNGQFDVRMYYGTGDIEELRDQTLAPGWVPPFSQTHISQIDVFPAGTL